VTLDRKTRIYVAGHRGMVGRAICRRLAADGYTRVVTRTRTELDLTDQTAVQRFFRGEAVDYVVLAAARVGGIRANNTYPAEFIYQNLMITAHVIHSAFAAGVRDLLFLGSSCIYPKLAAQPMREEELLGGWLEPTNEPYAVAKIAGIKLCESYNRQYGTRFRSVMPTNLYGPGDNYDLETSHVLPAMIRKFHLARLAASGEWAAVEADAARYGPIPAAVRDGLQNPAGPRVVLWGSGRPYREFLHVDDLAAACLFVMGLPPEVFRAAYEDGAGPPVAAQGIDGAPNLRPETCLLNVGTGRDQTIRELAAAVAEVVGFRGVTVWDAHQPDGTPRKRLDITRLTRLGWAPSISLAEGLARTYRAYQGETRPG
jgi:GDP-L-fucose synthase